MSLKTGMGLEPTLSSIITYYFYRKNRLDKIIPKKMMEHWIVYLWQLHVNLIDLELYSRLDATMEE